MMGGFGSGGHNRRCTGMVDAHRVLDASAMNKAGVFNRHWSGRWRWISADGETSVIQVRGGNHNLQLRYGCQVNDGPWQLVDEMIQVRWSTRHFGGAQAYFACPSCRRACRYLYGAGPRFLCRKCHGLTYRTSAAGNSFRTILLAQRLRAQIGASARLWSPLPLKPRYMRQAKFAEIVAQIREAERAALQDTIRAARELGIDVPAAEK